VNVYDLIPPALLEDALEHGHVRRQTHPSLPLAILNYTERATYDGVWNAATLNCRGLIVDETNGEIVARPFPKFFNYGQPGAPELDLDAPAIVTDKLDGSLGILYPNPRIAGGYSIATRGSFASDQAIHGTNVLALRYTAFGSFRPHESFTYLFEIVYPENRIVVDYGDLDDLVLLAAIETTSGRPSWRPVWPGLRAEEHPYRTLGQAIVAEPRPNAEGLVVYLPNTGDRVKIKQEDYVALHRIVTGLNKRTVWAHLDAGLELADLIAPLPDEFRPWVEDVVQELSALVVGQAREIEREFEGICAKLWGTEDYLCLECGGELAWVTTSLLEDGAVSESGWACTTGQFGQQFRTVEVPRRPFALLATESPWSWALFMRLDGRDYGPKLWHNAKPDPVGPAGRVYTEDVA
jgi:RNA ligase